MTVFVFFFKFSMFYHSNIHFHPSIHKSSYSVMSSILPLKRVSQSCLFKMNKANPVWESVLKRKSKYRGQKKVKIGCVSLSSCYPITVSQTRTARITTPPTFRRLQTDPLSCQSKCKSLWQISYPPLCDWRAWVTFIVFFEWYRFGAAHYYCTHGHIFNSHFRTCYIENTLYLKWLWIIIMQKDEGCLTL